MRPKSQARQELSTHFATAAESTLKATQIYFSCGAILLLFLPKCTSMR